jgi:choice-of-anchor C domain-containing protein
VVTGNRIDYLGPPWDVSDGVRALDLDGNGGIGGIAQTFATTLGQTYVVSFDLSGNPQGGPLVKDVRVEAGAFTQDYTFDTFGQTRENLIWQTITFSFVATGATTTLSFASLSPSDNSYGALIDNASVTAVPEPASLVLLETGLMWGGAAIRRRRVDRLVR